MKESSEDVMSHKPFPSCHEMKEGKKKLLRPYQEESTTSRLISEVKPLRAWLVLGLEITWEHQVS